MNALNFNTSFSKGKEPLKRGRELLKVFAVCAILILLWPFVQQMVMSYDETAGYISPGNMVLLVMLSLISFLVALILCGWLLQRFLAVSNLPGIGIMVLQFRKLELWQQLGLYWASFALLLLAAVACLIAIC